MEDGRAPRTVFGPNDLVEERSEEVQTVRRSATGEQRISLAHIAAMTGGQVVGNAERTVRCVRPIVDSSPDCISPVWENRLLRACGADIPLLAPMGWVPQGGDGVEVADVRGALCTLLESFAPRSTPERCVHPSAVVSPEAHVAASATVGPLCVVEKGARIGERAVLEAQVYLGEGVEIGDDSCVRPQAVLLSGVRIGARCLIHAGAVLGADGFGFLPRPGEAPRKIPQIGGVLIGDDVEIGACSTIDRGTMGDTRIGSGTKIDDHVHVGHNARVGERCILVAFTGLSGSSVVEDDVVLAARSGVADHVRVGKGAQLAALAGATKDVPPGAVVSGFPAGEHRRELRLHALVRRLPEIVRRMEALERALGVEGDRRGDAPERGHD